MLAASIDESLYRALAEQTQALENRGVKTAPFVVLIGANMPSVLVETSFLSNSDDEHNLRSGSYRQKIALALSHGIANYIQGLDPLRAASN